MKTNQLVAEFANDVARETERKEATSAHNEIRTLRDLEMVVVGGGSDDVPCW
jgi:hypothetical protein